MNKKTAWAFIAVVVVIVVIIVVVVVGGNHSAPAPSAQNGNNAAQTAQLPASYAAPADGFSANFPGTPTVASKAFTSPSAGSITETDYTYVSSVNGKGILYMIMVLHYPAAYKFSGNYLTGALQVFSTIINGKYPGTTVSAQPQSQFLGGSAITATVTVPFMGTPTPGNVLITTKNQNTYIVSAYGLSQNDYAAFLSSFTFAQ